MDDGQWDGVSIIPLLRPPAQKAIQVRLPLIRWFDIKPTLAQAEEYYKQNVIVM